MDRGFKHTAMTNLNKAKSMDRGYACPPYKGTTGQALYDLSRGRDDNFYVYCHSPLGQMISLYKSRHSGLFFSINASFHTRFHFFTLFSLVMALSIVS